MTDVLIIGGGVAGLACAVALADRGMRPVVLEGAAHLGGRAACWTDRTTGDDVDIGPHIFHSEYRNMLALMERLGTRERICWQPGKVIALASRPALALRHAPLPPPLSLMPDMLRAPGLTLRDYLSMIPTGWRGMQLGEEDVAALDAIDALTFLRKHGVTERLIDWWWRFAAMVVTSVPLERCSAGSLLRIHAQLSGYRGLHFGFGAVGLGELYAPQAQRIIEGAGGRVLTGCAVREVLGAERVEGVRLADGSTLHAPHVVSAVPAQAVRGLLPPAWRDAAPFARLDTVEPSPYISCYLWFDRPIAIERFWSHLYSPDRLNYDFYDLTQIRHGWSGRPTVIASNIIYSHRAHALSDDEIVQATVRELAEFAPAAQAKLVHARVHRIPQAIPCPLPGFEALRPGARTPIPGLVLAGDWTRTALPCTMESAARSGALAAEQVLAERGRPARIAIEARAYDGIAGAVRGATVAYRKLRGGSGPR